MKKMIKISIVVMIMLSCTILYSVLSDGVASAKVEQITVYYNEQEIIFDTEPTIVNGRTMVPVRAIFETFGMTVTWNGELRQVTAFDKGLEIVLTIGSKEVRVNNNTMTIDVEPYIDNNDRTMVPLRFIAESTGAEVLWDGLTRTVYINEVTEASQGHDIYETDVLYTYNIVDTGQSRLFSDNSVLEKVEEGDPFYGQDGNYDGNQPDYEDNGDGTVTDHVTGLMWQQTMDSKMTYDEAIDYANESLLGGYDDWRIPSIKELFSLIMYTGQSGGEVANILFIDTEFFNQPIGDVSAGEREIDAQVWSSTKYVGVTMHGDETLFGVNFVDGRIKGYGMTNPRTRDDNEMYFRLVRGNEHYGENVFLDNGDGTISDLATGLMWQMADDGEGKDWEEALLYAENLDLASYDDWRLPNAKELQSIVDYSKSMQTTGTAAIDDLFVLTQIIDPNGDENYGFYWSSTTHEDGKNTSDSAAYVSFGEAQGQMHGEIMDVHGAGAVRSDPKSGDINDFPEYFGPQGDIRYVYNYVLCVRDIN